MYRPCRSAGFTLIELLVVVVVIGILAGIAVPNYIGAQRKSRVAAVRANMHTNQISAESAATDSGGYYPDISVLRKYMPNGGNDPGGADGNWPVNPYTNAAGPPDNIGLSDLATINAAKAQPTGSISATAGNVGYSVTTDTYSYAVMGFDEAGKSLSSSTSNLQLVLSNQ